MIDHHVFESKKIVYHSLGCKLNFAETSSLGKIMEASGYVRIRPGEKPDVCVINTCSVTETADKKDRQAIHKFVRQYPDAFMVVTGCYAQLKPEEIATMPGVDLVLGSNQKFDLPAHLETLKKGNVARVDVSEHKDIQRFLPSCSRGDRTRYFLKVQDGCDYYCTYCTIPIARGRSRNPDIASLVQQATEVAAEGGKEIVLTGVNIGDFGKSNGETFLELIKALDEVEGIERFRISSIEPNLLTNEVIHFVAGSKRFAPHFHIPLQAGDDELLKLMHRRYDTALFASKIEAIRREIPNAFIGVDVIVGSRGETPELFEKAFRFIEQLDVSQLHVFTYSERPGTKALQIGHTVSSADKKARSARLLRLSDEKWRNFYQLQSEKEATVLFEHTKTDGMMHGFTENYIRVEIPYASALVNCTVRVKLQHFNADRTALKADILL
ncbi:MAG TPA: tRNA (N(6)-L-threonylcarbamoyladenosine(37)-C(2))-methylthiotransferase MtaB [Bacteroidales bacterium]|nr:tRNA (N(6)-L-threonylcarbamoyladenosine(37)-C(2))-methylthiotransferase MtaB [Bacteroidales bacterium]